MTRTVLRYIFLTGLPLVFLLAPKQIRAANDTLLALEYYTQGEAFMESEQLDSAIHFLGMAQSIYDELDSLDYYVNTTTAIAVCHYYTGDLSGAGKVLESAEQRVEKSSHGDEAMLQAIYDLLGPVYEAMGDLDRALKVSIKSLDRVSEGNATADKANLLNNIGAIYFSKGDFHQAADYYKAAFEHFGETTDKESQARALVNLGLAEMRQHRFKEAEETLEAALDMLENKRSPKNDRTAVLGRNHLALCYIERDFAEIAPIILELNLILYDLDSGDEALVRANRGFAYAELNNYESAVSELTLAIELAEENLAAHEIATMHLHLAEVTSQGPDPAVSYQHYSKGIALLCEDAGIAPTEMQSQPNPEESPAAVRVRDKRTLFRLLAGRGRLALTHDPIKGHDPVQDFRNAFFMMDLMRSDLITPNAKNFLATYVSRLNDDAMALFTHLYRESSDVVDFGYEVLERRKAMNLLESVLYSWQATMSAETRERLEKARQVQVSLDLYERSLYQAEREEDQEAADRFRAYVLNLREELRELTESGKDNATLRDYRQQVMSLDQMRTYAKEQNTWVVEFGLADTILVAICTGPESVKTHFFTGKEEVDALRSSSRTFARLVSDWESALSGGSKVLDTLSREGWAIYEALLEPILPKDDQLALAVIPDGVLNFVPFEALLNSKPLSGTGYSGLPYLLKQREISYGYSGTLLSRVQSKPVQEDNQNPEPACLAFAPGSMGDASSGEKLSVLRDSDADLPGARREVNALANSFEGAYYLGESATEQAFRENINSQSYEIIHLAMHGILDPDQHAYSYLAFESNGSEEEEDGHLQDFEIRQLDFSKTKMVVLSACETGLGKYVDGEGVMSLGRSFVQGGANSVVMSLWKLEDGASSQLMEHFYTALKAGETRRSALRKAKLAYLEEADDLHAHPAFWAGYILLGDTDALVLPPDQFPWWWIALGTFLVIAIGTFFLIRRKRLTSPT